MTARDLKEMAEMADGKGIKDGEIFYIMSRPFENSGVRCTGHCEGHFKFVDGLLLKEGTQFSSREPGYTYTGQWYQVEGEIHWGDLNYITR